jgi:DNA-binding LytR/AlgR family response regulator
MTVAICDDEKILRDSLMTLVKNHSADCRIDLYDSGNALLESKKDYDIYFLDIQMPGIDGIKTATQIRKAESSLSRESVIIFITALKEYMANAFDVKAFHYLVKPLDENKFEEVFSRAVSDCEKANTEKHILIKSGNTYHKIFVKDISYVESHGKKVIINVDGEALEYYGKITELENTLGGSFFRSHRCYLVNMSFVSRYNATSIWLKNGEEIFLAQKKFQEFVKTYMRYAKSGGLANE